MLKQQLIAELDVSEQFFNNSSKMLAEGDSGFSPKEGMYSTAQQVKHIAGTIHWYLDGAFNPDGFDMDFEKHEAILRDARSLEKSRGELKEAFDRARSMVRDMSEEDWMAPLPEGPVMGGLPRFGIIGAIVEHTAHHRGSLATYTRLLGKVPPMPYM